MKNPSPGPLFFLAVLSTALGSSYGALLIDGFQESQNVTVFGPPAGVRTVWISGAADAIGGERELQVTRNSGNLAGVELDIGGIGTGFATYSSDLFTTGSGTLIWDGVDNSPTINPIGLGALDLTQNGVNHAFSLNLVSDLPGTLIRMRVYQDATHISEASLLVPTDPGFNFVNRSIPFGAFAPVGSAGGANFTKIGALTLTFDGSVAGADIGLEAFAAVPEGGTIAAGMATAMLSLGAILRRRLKVA